MKIGFLFLLRNTKVDMFNYYLAFLISIIISLAGFLMVYRVKKQSFHLLLKIFALLTGLVLIFRYCLADLYLEGVLYGTLPEGFSSSRDMTFALILHWVEVTAILAVILYPFFKKVKTLKLLTAFIFPIVFIVSVIFLENLLLANFGLEIYNQTSVRGVLLSIELGLGLTLSICGLIDYILNFKNDEYKVNWINVLYATLTLVCMVAITMPNYLPQILFDPYRYAFTVKDLNIYHRVYLYPIIIVPIALYLILKDKSEETKTFALLYYALAGLFIYTLTHKFEDFTRVSGLPFHLCNTALYITPLCLIFKWKKVFYFTYFINVLGAFLAMAMPNYGTEGISGTLLVFDTLNFFRSHYQAFYMPLLIVGLGIFERPRLREFKYSLVAFAVYYFIVLVLNGWFTNYDEGIDYFFINSDFIADKLGNWALNLRRVTIEFNIGDLVFKYYPVYQVLYFSVYIVLSLAMWFVYELAYDVVSGWKDIAKRNQVLKMDALALEVSLNGRDKGEPMDLDSTNKLILKNFTKRYGTSDVYAVKDACLEVTGGEVFGFLGPNGAGKSTIIKSIVGIQTITDGAISVCGYDVKTQSVEAKSQIGFVPDHYALYEKLTAREYVNYIADLYNVPKEVREERLNGFIKQFEFEFAIDNPIKTYSHGMKQKVTIMAALIHDPKVWILDEPLTGLDPNSIFQVKECMKNHAKKGNIVFFSSHIIDVVEKICDKIAIIKKGQIQCVKTVEEIEKTDSLENFYMDIINGKEVEAIKVEKAVKGV